MAHGRRRLRKKEKKAQRRSNKKSVVNTLFGWRLIKGREGKKYRRGWNGIEWTVKIFNFFFVWTINE
jgi:hypothetical protein